MPRLVAPALPPDVLSRLGQPNLPADGLVLRPWRPGDAGAVVESFADPDIQRWHMRRMDSAAEASDWIESWASAWQADTDASWAVTRAEDNAVIGCASLRNLLPFAATAQVSYWTIPAARGATVATRATRAVTAWAVANLGLHRMYLTHSLTNRVLPSGGPRRLRTRRHPARIHAARRRLARRSSTRPARDRRLSRLTAPETLPT